MARNAIAESKYFFISTLLFHSQSGNIILLAWDIA